MAAHDLMSQRVLEVIVRSPNSCLDEIVLECPDVTWNQIFLAIDRLSREGIIHLIPKGRGIYTIHVSRVREPSAQHPAVA
jgi:hypothetical protein